LKKFTTICGATIPASLQASLEKFGDDDAATTEFGIEFATRQCDALLKNGVPGIHFYTLNKPYSTTRIVENLGLHQRP
jgi:methylenetetrahydrofolate reductase (NADPH)